MSGESIVEASIVENKMGESVISGATLEPSVSFGRFENDSLSWEKWSSFSPNKYLEEVEKCSTPGSVAEKKAYFEAHYKKIAAQKAEQLEQEKLMESAPPCLDENHIEASNGERPTEVEYGAGVDIAVNSTTLDDSKEVRISPDVGVVVNSTTLDDSKEVSISPDVGIVVNSTNFDDSKEDSISPDVGIVINCTFGDRKEDGVSEDVGIVVNGTSFDDSEEGKFCAGEGQSSLVEDIKDELDGSQSNTIESIDREKITLLEEEYTSQKSPPDVKQAPKVVKEAKRAPESEKKNASLKARNITQKKNPSNKDQTLAGTKKKVVSPATKSSPISAPRLSRATPTSASMSASQSSTKKLNGTHLPRNRITLMEENRRAAPKSLHMSLSLGQANSSASPAPTRKSLIMEQMADKDIIKRAFKAFQNSYGHLRSSGDDKFNGLSKVSSKVPEGKVTPLTPSRENEGLRRAADKRIAQRGQLQTKLSPASSGLGPSVAKKNVKTFTPSVGLKIDERSEKRREFLKNLEEKSIARGAEKAKLGVKLKDKDGNVQKLKQNSNQNATPARNYSKGGLSKSLQMEGFKNKVDLRNR